MEPLYSKAVDFLSCTWCSQVYTTRRTFFVDGNRKWQRERETEGEGERERALKQTQTGKICCFIAKSFQRCHSLLSGNSTCFFFILGTPMCCMCSRGCGYAWYKFKKNICTVLFLMIWCWRVLCNAIDFSSSCVFFFFCACDTNSIFFVRTPSATVHLAVCLTITGHFNVNKKVSSCQRVRIRRSSNNFCSLPSKQVSLLYFETSWPLTVSWYL